jgi:hypothetical protein
MIALAESWPRAIAFHEMDILRSTSVGCAHLGHLLAGFSLQLLPNYLRPDEYGPRKVNESFDHKQR